MTDNEHYTEWPKRVHLGRKGFRRVDGRPVLIITNYYLFALNTLKIHIVLIYVNIRRHMFGILIFTTNVGAYKKKNCYSCNHIVCITVDRCL